MKGHPTIRISTLVAGLIGMASFLPLRAAPAHSNLKKVLVFDKNGNGSSMNFEARRDFKSALGELSATYGFDTTLISQNDPIEKTRTGFSPENLAAYQTVLFDFNEGIDIFVPEELRPGFEAWILNGGTFIAIHDADAFIANWPFMVDALAQVFFTWDQSQASANLLHDPEGLLEGSETKGIYADLAAPDGFVDRFIAFHASPRGQAGVTILVTVDEKSYSRSIGPLMGDDHPLAWVKQVGKGKAIHLALGNSYSTVNAFEQNDGYLKKLLYGTLRYAAGDFVGCMDENFQEYNPDATKSDSTACRHLGGSAIRSEAVTGLESVHIRSEVGRLIQVDFSGHGAHEVTLIRLGGGQLEHRLGSGPAHYAFTMPLRPGIYFVVAKAAGETKTRRIFVLNT